MSSSSRSTVSVAPHHVEPPPTRATGAKTRASTFVQIHLHTFIDNVEPDHVLERLYRTFALVSPDCEYGTLKTHASKTQGEKEDWLRAFADQTIARCGLLGCVVLTPKQEVQQRRDMRVHTLTNPALAFAILTKSSAQLFIAAKTPNLNAELLTRELFTADARIAALAQRSPP